MITISLCMIVKNEEAVLARCLDSVAGLMDEIIIVDTGSQDGTKQAAARYTDRIYDFEWTEDFSAARNFAFSRATKEYIYSADADEVLDEQNRERFLQLKKTLLPEVEIVQMKYGNQLQFGTVYNFDEEYRPKLFKRLRPFVWEEKVHEAVRLAPLVYDSEVVITHLPTGSHGSRDLLNLYRQTLDGGRLSKRLHNLYARELMLVGQAGELDRASAYFEAAAADVEREPEEVAISCCVAARAARLKGDTLRFFKYACKVIAGEGCSEICFDLGQFYENLEDFEEAVIWYYNAAFETQPLLDLRCSARWPREGLARCYRAMGLEETALEYEA